MHRRAFLLVPCSFLLDRNAGLPSLVHLFGAWQGLWGGWVCLWPACSLPRGEIATPRRPCAWGPTLSGSRECRRKGHRALCWAIAVRPFGASRRAREWDSARRVRGVAAMFGVRGFLPAGLRRVPTHPHRRSARILSSVRTQRRAGCRPAPLAARRPRRPGAHGGPGPSLGPLVLRTSGPSESLGHHFGYRARTPCEMMRGSTKPHKTTTRRAPRANHGLRAAPPGPRSA